MRHLPKAGCPCGEAGGGDDAIRVDVPGQGCSGQMEILDHLWVGQTL